MTDDNVVDISENHIAVKAVRGAAEAVDEFCEFDVLERLRYLKSNLHDQFIETEYGMGVTFNLGITIEDAIKEIERLRGDTD